jgi:hypothetical protein
MCRTGTFGAIYPPGQLYLLAGVYKVFGVSLLASRVYDVLVRFIFVTGFFLVARKITHPGRLTCLRWWVGW